MKRLQKITMIAGLAACCALPGGLLGAHRARERNWTSQERQLREVRTLPAGGKVVVDTLWGSIRVVGGTGDQVQMTATERVSGPDAESRDRARHEVTLRIEKFGGGVRFYVDGPFRCPQRRDDWCRWDDTYKVAYDFQLRVPREAALELKTVMDGDVTVDGVRGAFTVANVNGAITLDGLAGAGSARTVNGAVRARFAENPRGAASFETVNGDVDVALRRGLAADLRLRTMNGDIFSEYDYRPLPGAAVSQRKENGRFVYQVDHSTAIRIGAGGPRLELETLNGDLLIRNQDQKHN